MSEDLLGSVYLRAATDLSFRAHFLDDPHGAFQDMGINIPPGVKIKIHENAEDLLHFVIPLRKRSGTTPPPAAS